MSTPIKSKNYNLIGYSGTEIPTFLYDLNNNNEIIDSELKRLSDVVNNAESLADTVNEHTEILKVYGNRISGLEESVSTLQPENIENLENRVSIAETQIENNSNLIDALTTRLTDDEDNISQHAIRIGNLEQKTGTLETSISELSEKLNTETTNLNERVNVIETNVSSLDSNIASISNKVDALDADVDGVHEAIQTNANNIQTASNNIANLQGRMTYTESEIIKLSQKSFAMYYKTGNYDSETGLCGTVSDVTGGIITDANNVKGIIVTCVGLEVSGKLDESGNIHAYSSSHIPSGSKMNIIVIG